MGSLVYIRLIGYTAGTLLQLFWMVVILGYRRQRNFERVFFFLCLALFFFYGGSLLALNAQIYYATPPAALHLFSIAVVSAGLILLPPLLVHLHVEFADTRGLVKKRSWKWVELLLAYAPVPFFALRSAQTFLVPGEFDFVLPIRSFKIFFAVWFFLCLLRAADWQRRLAQSSPEKPERRFHASLSIVLVVSALAVYAVHVLRMAPGMQVGIGTALALLPILPLTLLVYFVQRYNFLQFGRQKNLLYAVSATFLALLYLSLVRRVGIWLEPVLPPEASAAVLLFVLVVFIEPLQRVLGQTLRETAKREMELVKRVAQEIQEEAKHGDLARLLTFTKDNIKTTFELSKVTLTLGDKAIAGAETGAANPPSTAGPAWKPPYFPILRGDKLLGLLRAEPHGAALSGDTCAALEFLCEQLPGSLDLCRLINEKLLLERELAERERLALLGQMAASISHNLKNPLGSIKTILQVQLENPELPETVRGETRIVLDEIGRLSAKLNQLLQFSRPAVRGGSVAGSCDARAVVEEVAGVLRHEAERRGIALEVNTEDGNANVAASAEAVNDIVSNLLVNALEATSRGGHVVVKAATENGLCSFTVEDDGPGIPAAVREKILQPFFTTKAQGTGLGLAIVARRVAEFSGRLEWRSPLADGQGTRFRVTLPGEEVKK